MDERNHSVAQGSSEESQDEKRGSSRLYGTVQDAVERHSHCPICNAHLHFTHITDFGKNLTQETARCPECGIKVRQLMHRLQ